jgi:hypothetical protein
LRAALALVVLSACRTELVVGDAPPDAPPALPNLAFVPGAVLATPYVQTLDFDPHACEVVEGCVGGFGDRRLLRFDALTANLGAADLVIGPTPPPGVSSGVYVWSPCHMHHHVRGFEDYALEGAGGVVLAGHKQAYCLRDDVHETGGEPKQFSCTDQGISAGWADLYQASLACQWIDVTDVPPGQYTVHITVNPDHAFAESDYDDDETTFTVVL